MFLISKIRKKIVTLYSNWLNSSESVAEKTEKIRVKERHNITDPDFIDYDGMGNQGRFPSSRER